MNFMGHIKALLWFFKIQWQTAPGLSLWAAGRDLLRGLLPIAQAYLIARLFTGVGQIGFGQVSLADSQIYLWLSLVFVIGFIQQAVESIDGVAGERLGNRIYLELNKRLMEHVYRLGQSQFDNQDLADKLERARSSAGEIWMVPWRLGQLVSNLIGLVAALVVIFIYSPLIALGFVLMIVAIAVYSIRANSAYEVTWQTVTGDSRIANSSSWRLLDLRTMAEVRLLNAFGQLFRIWQKHQTIRNAAMEKVRLKYLKAWLGIGLLQPAVSTAASFYYVSLVVRGSLNLEGFIFLRNILTEVDIRAVSLLASINYTYTNLLDLDHYNQVYQVPVVEADGTKAVKPPLTIEFQNVSFAYSAKSDLVLNKVSFCLKPREHLALVGVNGAGKTTLVRLLLRQYLPTKGKILVNGIDIRHLKLSCYLDKLGSLGQDLLMFDYLSLRENMLAGCLPSVTDKQIYQATDLVQMTDYLQALPQRLDCRLGTSFEAGVDLSYGQRQRLAIARALIRASHVLILDEPTSSIDAKSELAIFSNIYRHFQDKSLLIVAHRFASIRLADRILVLDKGTIKEQGNHQQLMAKAGLYQQMFKAQAEAYQL